jgi:HD-GYP domain-containing protein (c-di-GMP phosphodiesterase class II)
VAIQEATSGRVKGKGHAGASGACSPRPGRASSGLRALSRLGRCAPQPLLGLTLLALGLLSLALSWHATLVPPPLHAFAPVLTLTNLGLALVLGAGAVLAQLYPIHVARAFKISTLTIPLFLLAALTPPPVAATAAGIALLIGELAQRQVKGQLPSDIAATVGRSIVIVLLSSLVAHTVLPPVAPLVLGGGVSLPLGAPIVRLPLVLAAGVLFLGDVLTVALEIGAITGEAPHRIVRMVLRESGVAEGVQYLVGLLGVLAARQDAWAVVLLLVPALLLRRLLKRGMQMDDETRPLLESMADAVDLRDPYTGGHSRRVTGYTTDILRALKINGPEVELITAAARVHDIGKIAIPDSILNKAGRLTDEERAVMESHPQRGADFLARYPDFRRGLGIVLHHHERQDGAGYPAGLRGNDIPFGARVLAVADSFDAMTSDRPYRTGMSFSTAARILAEGRGTQWDSTVVDVFVEQVIPSLLSQREATGLPEAPAVDRMPAAGHVETPLVA